MTVQTYPSRAPINWSKPPKATDMVYYDQIAGDSVPIRGSLFAIAALDDLNTKALARFGKPVHVIQPCYHTGYAPSAGTHDFDYCMDWRIGMPGDTSVSWLDMQWFGRVNGWACWWRHTGTWANPSAYHIHGFPLPSGGKKFPTEVGLFIDGGVSTRGHEVASSQLDDYWNHSEGLAGQHAKNDDPTPFPKDIVATIFNLKEYIAEKEANMPLSQDDLNKIQAIVKDVLNEDVLDLRNPDGSVKKKISIVDAVQRELNDGK